MRRTAAARAVATGGAGGGPASATSTATAARGGPAPAAPLAAAASAIRTVRGPPGVASVTVAPRPSASTAIGGSSATPCEPSVRRRSTGSPPAPRSARTATRVMVRSTCDVPATMIPPRRSSGGDEGDAGEGRATAPASWCGAMRSRSTPNASSTVTTGYSEPSTATRLR